MLDALARCAVRHRFLVLAAWLVVLVGGGVAAGTAGGTTRSEYVVPQSESARAQELMSAHGLAGNTDNLAIAVFHDPAGLQRSGARAQEVLAEIRRQHPHGAIPQTISPADVSADGTTATVPITFTRADGGALTRDERVAVAGSLRRLAGAADGLTVAFGGPMLDTQADVPGSGAIGIVAAIVILLLAFGSVLAMAIPIVVAIFGAGTGIAFTMLAANVIDMPSAATALASMVAAGVGIDYSLLIVTRYRELAVRDADVRASTVTAQGTAGRAVFFAGGTVVVALLGLLVMDMPLINGIAVGAAIAVTMTLLAALTLLPALLAVVGHRIDTWALPWVRRHELDSGFFLRWSRAIQRRPIVATVASLAALAILTIPVLDLRLGFSDASARPRTDTTRVAYDLVSDKFARGANGPLLLVVDATRLDDPHRDQVLDRLRTALTAHPEVVTVGRTIVSDDGRVGVLMVESTGGPADRATDELVTEFRQRLIPAALTDADRAAGATVSLTGPTAATIDYARFIEQRLPVFIAVVLGIAFVLLLLVFRSVVVPLKAVLMNVVSIGAAYGFLVAVVQWGRGQRLLGFETEMPVVAWVPMMMFAVVFGLSMDYEVFLLSRMKEAYAAGHPNAQAVTLGLARTGRVITAAAGIMICVFGAFVLGPDVDLAVFGLGLAVAVFVDATLVRMILVPACMELLGRYNWWLPAWLDRILPAEAERPTLRPVQGGAFGWSANRAEGR